MVSPAGAGSFVANRDDGPSAQETSKASVFKARTHAHQGAATHDNATSVLIRRWSLSRKNCRLRQPLKF
jgi:hypothetical protein